MLLPALIRDRTLIDHRRHGGAVVVRTSALRALWIRSPTNVVLKVLRIAHLYLRGRSGTPLQSPLAATTYASSPQNSTLWQTFCSLSMRHARLVIATHADGGIV